MKIQDVCRAHKKIVIIAVSFVTVLVIAGVTVFFFLRKNGGNQSPFGKGDFTMGGAAVGENMVSASGITSVGVTQESFDVEGLTEGLLIEEVYVSSGDELGEGDKILKLSEESVAQAREELEETLRDAELAYRAGVIEYEQNKITIAYERDMAVLAGQQAQEVYDETIESLDSSVERAQEELDETNEQIAEYQEIVGSDDYDTVFKVGEYKDLYDENLELLTTRMEEWGVSWSQVVSGAGQTGSSGNSGNGGMLEMGNVKSTEGSVSGSDAAVQGTADVYSQYVSVLQSLYRVLEQNLADYEQAQEDYEDAVANAQLNLQTLELSVSSLEEALKQAKSDYETQVLQAKLTLEQTLAAAERAESDYETALEKAESDYETLKDAKEDAEENLALFESSVGDGYYYAAQSGSILRVMAQKNRYLTSDGTIFMYTDPETMTVTVSVDQSDIARIEVGDEAYIEASEYGSFQGSVTEINPVSQSDSRTNVTYNVTVVLTGDIGNLATNETVTVIFGIGGAANEEEN